MSATIGLWGASRRPDSAGRCASKSPGFASRVPWFLVSTIGISTILRYPGLLWPLSPDEAGFLEVARNVHPTADSLYGTYWVDRSPILIGAYWLFERLAGEYGMRVFAALFAALMITAVYYSCRILAGPGGGRLGAAITACLLANPGFNAWTGKGELFGTSLVAVSVWMTLVTLSGSGRRVVVTAFTAGLAGALAVGFKQSLVGGLAFAGVLLAIEAARAPSVRRRSVLRSGAVLMGGALLPAVAVVVWVAAMPPDLGTLWYQVFGFRADAAMVIASGHTSAPLERAEALWSLAKESRLAYGIGLFVLAAPWTLRRLPAQVVAVGSLLIIDVAATVMSGSYWHAYLIPLFPGVSMALAIVYATAGWRRWLAVGLAASMCLASTRALDDFTDSRTSGAVVATEYNAGRAIAAAARPGDTIISLYGAANVVEASGLTSPYQHLWSLPMRTLDPGGKELVATLNGDRAPTWIVVVLPLTSWGLDADRSVSDVLERRYTVVAEGCGRTIYHLAEPGAPTRIDFDCDRAGSVL